MKTRAMALSAEMQRVQREIQELHAEKAKMVEDFNQWAQNKEHQLLEQSNQRVEQRVEQMRQELLQQMEQQREAERSASQEPLHKMTEDLRNMKDMLVSSIEHITHPQLTI